ncbi:CHAP domain-containing protein [Candidatus Saccharibacteria bacterium]|nr:CHAP domain-containing protein [Candidatus Saccharibacteria bacterium]
MKTQKRAKLKYLIAAFVLVVTAVFGLRISSSVKGISRACQDSPECMEAVEKEKEATRNAAAAQENASQYEIKVSQLNLEIAVQQAKISQTELQIDELTQKIAEDEQTLRDEQDALASLLIKMHFNEDAEPIKILASSTSISDLAEKKAREEVARRQISTTATIVKERKERLENEKIDLENLLFTQQQTKNALAEARAEQQALVEKYQNDADAYAVLAEEAKQAKLEAERRQQEAHPELYRGSSYTGENTYPWQYDCPGRQDDYVTYWEDYFNGWQKIGGLVCECVSYAGWKAYEQFGIAVAWGNAYSWDDNARYNGYRVDHNPAPNTIGQADGGMWGHVFWVEDVNIDGSINVTEYNNAWATMLYSGDQHYGDFGSRRIPANEIWQYNFIHFD